jgi:thiamine-phosphate pyrophosphorylase
MLLYYITNRRAFAGNEVEQRQALLKRIAEAAAAGIDYIQLREKDLCSRELERLAKDALAAVRANSSAARLLINSRTDVAIACGADGVHLPANSLPASEVRALWMRALDRAPVIGVSAHSVEDVVAAEAEGADFAVLAPIFEKPGTQVPGLGPDSLSLLRSRFPVLALGGVNLDNAAPCLHSGAAGVAGIRLFQEGRLRETVRILRKLNW